MTVAPSAQTTSLALVVPTEHERLRDLAATRNPLGRSAAIDGIWDFDNRGDRRANISRLAAAIEEPTRFRSGPDGGLYRYADGVYLPDGEELVRQAAMACLAQAYKASVVNEVVRFYLDREVAQPLSFNPDPGSVIRAANGILDLGSWELTPYTPENATTVQIPWALKDAQCPGIDKFLIECFDGNRELVDFMYEVAGYTAMTRNSLRLAFLLFGVGHNGKSIYLHLLTCMLGKRNTVAVPLNRLGGDDRFSPARLVAKLANICGDIGTQSGKDMSLFKQATGGDYIHAERKFKEPFDSHLRGHAHLLGQRLPRLAGHHRAYKDRWVAVEWTQVFEDDESVEERLKALGQNQAEMEGFLLQAALGAKRVKDQGRFTLPDAVRSSTERFWRATDSFESFVSDTLALDPEATTPGEVLYEVYKSYCEVNGLKLPLGRNRMYEKLRALSGVYKQTDPPRNFVDVRQSYEVPG